MSEAQTFDGKVLGQIRIVQLRSNLRVVDANVPVFATSATLESKVERLLDSESRGVNVELSDVRDNVGENHLGIVLLAPREDKDEF